MRMKIQGKYLFKELTLKTGSLNLIVWLGPLLKKSTFKNKIETFKKKTKLQSYQSKVGLLQNIFIMLF